MTLLSPSRARFTPKHVAGLAAHYDASRITGLADAAAITTLSNRTSHGSARDLSSAGGARPVYKTGIKAGLAVVRFASASSQYMEGASAFLSGSSGSVFLVASMTAGGPTIQTLTASMDKATSNLYFSQTRLQDFGGGFATVCAQRANDTTDSVSASASNITAGTWYILEYHSSGTAFEMRRDGTAVTKSVVAGADNGDWFGDTPNRDSVSIGAQVDSGGATRFFNGDMGELAIYDGVALSDYNKRRIRRYLSTKWEIAVS